MKNIKKAEFWSCIVCELQNRQKNSFCCRCGHYPEGYKRNRGHEELSGLYSSFIDKEISFPELKIKVLELLGKAAELKILLDSFIHNEKDITEDQIGTFFYELNSLKGTYTLESSVFIKDLSKFDLSKGIIFTREGLGYFKYIIKTIDHVTCIMEWPLDGYVEDVQVAFPEETDFFLSLKIFLEDYKIPLSKVYLPENYADKMWPFPTYQLWREDDNVNRYLMDEFYIKSAAQKKSEEYLARAHKQDYWVKEINNSEGVPIKCLNDENSKCVTSS